jgi:vacuolar-type H+-ATPase subunit F/Vma7
MYKAKIYLIGENNANLIALEETGYISEKELQEFLAEYPDLLPGDQIDPENPRRWLLIGCEISIPGDATQTGRWSLDHLFLDQDGIPTFVECKRADDTRIRREVVAQMLDYAANGLEYWSVERLRQTAAETAQRRGRSLNDEIMKLLEWDNDSEANIEEYWQRVEVNLRNRRVRLIFVADHIPKELRRLVEFLNEEMSNVEVLAVEVKQFQREGDQSQRALVSRIVGLSETARSMKGSAPRHRGKTTPEEFLSKCGSMEQEFFQRVLSLAEERGYIVYWGEVGFSIRIISPKTKQLASFAYGYPPNIFQLYLHDDWVLDEEWSLTLRERLLDFGVFREAGKYTLTATLTQENLARMSEAYDFIIDQIDKYITGAS